MFFIPLEPQALHKPLQINETQFLVKLLKLNQPTAGGS